MKNQLLSITSLILAATVPTVFAGEPYDRNGEPNYQYRSSTGTQYQYDRSNPRDEVRYEVDVKAQMRDELSVDPRREIDQSLGQSGGGIRR